MFRIKYPQRACSGTDLTDKAWNPEDYHLSERFQKNKIDSSSGWNLQCGRDISPERTSSMEQPVDQKKKGFLDRPVRLKWPVYIIGLLILLGLVLHVVKLWQMNSLREQAREAIRNEIKAKGQSLAETIAVTSRDDIRNGNYDKLQEYFADLVKLPQGDIQYLIVMKLNGEAVAHTNTKFRGKRLDDPYAKKALQADRLVIADAKKYQLYDIAVPVMGFTSRAAIVRVGISYARADDSFKAGRG